MTTVKALFTAHPYYCSTSNYFSNEASLSYKTMGHFLDEFEDADIDMNLMFRFDIHPPEPEEGKKFFTAEIFLIQQRKGIFTPVTIDQFKDEDADRFKAYALRHWEYMNKIWTPISTKE